LLDIAPRGRTTVAADAELGTHVLARWLDGAPLIEERVVGRGAILVLTVPLTTEESDFVLRPAFLAFLDRFVDAARSRGAPSRIEVGEAWTFDDRADVSVTHIPNDPRSAPTPVRIVDDGGGGPDRRRVRALASLAGLYSVRLGGDVTTRVAAVPEREIDFRPRRAVDSAPQADLGGRSRSRDASPEFAMLLVALVGIEAALRIRELRRGSQGAPAVHGKGASVDSA
jgi:hypothetical protein